MLRALGDKDYTTTYVTSKVQACCDEVKRLAQIADIFPHHAAYAAFTHGLFGRWSYRASLAIALARALAASKCSIHAVHCNSVPYEFPNQINDKCNTNKYVNVVKYL